MDNSRLQLTPSSKKQCTKESNITSNSNYASPELHELSYERSHVSSVKDSYEINRLKQLVKQSLQTRQFRKELHNQLGALGQKYVNMLLNDDREKAIDHIYAYSLSARMVRCAVTNILM